MTEIYPPLAKPSGSRIASIDALRGLTILLMIFVNDVGGVELAPWWMKHFLHDHVSGINDDYANGFTFVDVIFPAFLFIVGMAIPFALGRRMDRGESLPKVWTHIIVRTLGLLLIGVYMIGTYTVTEGGRINPHLWSVLMYLMVILVWNTPPKEKGALRSLFRLLQTAGILGLLALAVFFHGEHDPSTMTARAAWWPAMMPISAVVFIAVVVMTLRGKGSAGLIPVMAVLCGLYFIDSLGSVTGQWQVDMRPMWWGILGLIGWAYLVACISYTLLRRQPAMLMGVAALLYCLFIADRSGVFHGWPLRGAIDFGSMLGSHAAITVTGVILGMMLLPDSNLQTHRQRMGWALVYGFGLYLAGILLYQLHRVDAVFDIFKINKNAATPPWCLITTGITIWLWVGIYFIMDVMNWKKWAVIVRPAGENPLFAYILHPILLHLVALIGLVWFDFYAKLGETAALGITRAVIMAFLVVFLAGGLRKVGVWLRL